SPRMPAVPPAPHPQTKSALSAPAYSSERSGPERQSIPRKRRSERADHHRDFPDHPDKRNRSRTAPNSPPPRDRPASSRQLQASFPRSHQTAHDQTPPAEQSSGHDTLACRPSGPFRTSARPRSAPEPRQVSTAQEEFPRCARPLSRKALPLSYPIRATLLHSPELWEAGNVGRREPRGECVNERKNLFIGHFLGHWTGVRIMMEQSLSLLSLSPTDPLVAKSGRGLP